MIRIAISVVMVMVSAVVMGQIRPYHITSPNEALTGDADFLDRTYYLMTKPDVISGSERLAYEDTLLMLYNMRGDTSALGVRDTILLMDSLDVATISTGVATVLTPERFVWTLAGTGAINTDGTWTDEVSMYSGVELMGWLDLDENVAWGLNQFGSVTGSSNVALGYRSNWGLTGGSNNIGIGTENLFAIGNGETNVGIGEQNLYSATSGQWNVGIGSDNMRTVITPGNGNVAIGNDNFHDATTVTASAGFGNGNNRFSTSVQYTNVIGWTNMFNNGTSNYMNVVGYNNMYESDDVEYSMVVGGNNMYSHEEIRHSLVVGESNFKNGLDVVQYSLGIGQNVGLAANDVDHAYLVGLNVMDAATNLNNVFAFGSGVADATSSVAATNVFAVGNGTLGSASNMTDVIAIGENAAVNNAYNNVVVIGKGAEAEEANQVIFSNQFDNLTVTNYSWDVDQDTASKAGYYMGYDASSNDLMLLQLPGDLGNDSLGTAYAQGYIIYGDGTKEGSAEAELFWDETNNRLGIGTSSPAEDLEIFNSGGPVLLLERGGNDYGTLTVESTYLNIEHKGEFSSEIRINPEPVSSGAVNVNLFQNITTTSSATLRLHEGDGTADINAQFVGSDDGTDSYINALAGSGDFGIGTSSPAQDLHVEGTARITGSDGTATGIMGRDADGDISNLTLGAGISITSGQLEVSGSGDGLGTSFTNNRFIFGDGTTSGKTYSNARSDGTSTFMPRVMYLGNAVSTEDAVIRIAPARSGDGHSYVDLVSSSSHTISARMLRVAGVNGALNLYNWGTGHVQYFLNGSSRKVAITNSIGVWFDDYGSGSNTGTITYMAGWSSAGQFLEVAKTNLLAIDDLTDVVITSLATNDYLQYNGTNWVNVTATPGSYDLDYAGDTGSDAITDAETLTVAGGTNISTTVVGNTLTIAFDGESYDLDVSGNTGSGTIDDSETFSISGTNGVTTSMSGNTLTIDGGGTGSDELGSTVTDNAIVFGQGTNVADWDDNFTWDGTSLTGPTGLEITNGAGEDIIWAGTSIEVNSELHVGQDRDDQLVITSDAGDARIYKEGHTSTRLYWDNSGNIDIDATTVEVNGQFRAGGNATNKGLINTDGDEVEFRSTFSANNYLIFSGGGLVSLHAGHTGGDVDISADDICYISAPGDLRLSSNTELWVGNGVELSGSAVLEVQGNAYKSDGTTTWLTSSDRRIKRDITTIGNGLEVIGSLRPVSYKYRGPWVRDHGLEYDRQLYGFVAQEYAEIFPDDISDGEEGMMVLDQQAVVPHLVRAIQELEKQIAELRNMLGK